MQTFAKTQLDNVGLRVQCIVGPKCKDTFTIILGVIGPNRPNRPRPRLCLIDDFN